MKNNVIFKSILLVALLSNGVLSHAQEDRSKEKGWVNLFDGKTLNGWKSVGGKAPYSIEGETIVGRMTKGTPNSFLITEKEYGDFYFRVGCKT
ncbi:family 16 glycoside hydrolase [Sphingobacterium sp. SG20118]|uniref:family 16 glycoside hydrolase n=1 Tax=Sphingobacterium sp. SG20118 TaxID=3367156 RepID=UPI0037DFBF33